MQTKLAMWNARAFWWRVRWGAERAARGFRYAIGRATPTDGMRLLCEAERLCGHYALCSISAESVLNDMLDQYEPHPALARLCEQAAARVANKWSDSGDTSAAAIDWAMNLVREYAAEDGVALVDIGESTGAEVLYAHATEG